MNVGTRELKNRLSHYLHLVQKTGEPLGVTDRGELIAELRPIGGTGGKVDREILSALVASGAISVGTARRRDFVPIKPRRTISVSRLVLEARR